MTTNPRPTSQTSGSLLNIKVHDSTFKKKKKKKTEAWLIQKGCQ